MGAITTIDRHDQCLQVIATAKRTIAEAEKTLENGKDKLKATRTAPAAYVPPNPPPPLEDIFIQFSGIKVWLLSVFCSLSDLQD